MILSFGIPRMPYNAKNPQDFDSKNSGVERIMPFLSYVCLYVLMYACVHVRFGMCINMLRFIYSPNDDEIC